MSDTNFVTLKISGNDVRNGMVPVDDFASVLRKFSATIAFFDRIFTERPKRGLDLNVASLRRENPLVVDLSIESRRRGYAPALAVNWAFKQLHDLAAGAAPDPRMPIELLDNVLDLADRERVESITKISAEFGATVIAFDGVLAAAARLRRHELVERMPAPAWYSGVTKGTVSGELRGVTDLEGEREFFVVPASGPRRVRCIFTEGMRDEMNRLLFKSVKIIGFLHYEGNVPHASMVEAVRIEELPPTPLVHMQDLEGVFRDSYYPVQDGWPN